MIPRPHADRRPDHQLCLQPFQNENLRKLTISKTHLLLYVIPLEPQTGLDSSEQTSLHPGRQEDGFSEIDFDICYVLC